MELRAEHLALVKYWLTADLLRSWFFRRFAESNPRHLANDHGTLGLAYYWVSDPGILSSLWIAALYPVIEGYRELKLADPEIDRLLKSTFADDVRLYRNAVFHFQPQSLHEKHMPVLQSFEAKEWIDIVHRRFGIVLAERILGLTTHNGDVDAAQVRISLSQELAQDDA